MRYPVVELRQYTLRPGQRDVLIDLFDREFVETQEEAGMAILGQFRDLDRPDRFVWLRGFPELSRRAEALHRFYGGPAWKAHAAAANATMLDVDDVLLLRPVSAADAFPVPATGRASDQPSSFILVTLYLRDRPFDEAFAEYFDRTARPALVRAGAPPLACLWTEYAENDFPALPVRAGEHAFVWFARFGSHAELESARENVRRAVPPELAGATHQLRLAPTARSLLR